MKDIKATCEAVEALRREKSDTSLTTNVTPDGRDWGQAGILIQHGLSALDEGIPNKQRRRVEAGLRAVIEGAEDLRAWAKANGYFQEEVLDAHFEFPRRDEANEFAEQLRCEGIPSLFGYKDGTFTIRVGAAHYTRALAMFSGGERPSVAVNTHVEGKEVFMFVTDTSAEEFGDRLTKAGVSRIIMPTPEGTRIAVWVQKEDIKRAEEIFCAHSTGLNSGA